MYNHLILLLQQQNETSARHRRFGTTRTMSSMQTQQPGSLPDVHIDPYRLIEDDLKDVYDDIRQVII